MAACSPASSPRRAPHLALALLALLGAAPLMTGGAAAQAVLATVNTKPITSFDVDQRIRLVAATERRRLDRRTALRELVDDQVKLIEARRIGYRVTDDGVENEFSRLAKSNKQTSREFEDSLTRAGLSPNALRDKIRADLAWQTLVRDRAKSGSQISNSELETAIEQRRRETPEKVTEYRLYPVVFIVPRGVSPGSRLAAANAARGRFTSCEGGFDSLRAMPDVALRPSIVRSSADLPKPLAQLLDKTPEGRLTPPQPSPEGIEMVAVCEKRQVTNNANLRSNVATVLADKKLNDSTKAYLDQLREKAIIKYR